MADPWDVPPLPTRGDDSDDTTYAAVGRFISSWEGCEVTLSLLHAAFVKQPFRAQAMWEYGGGRIFAARLQILERAGCAHFRRKPDQDGEGDFKLLMTRVRGFSDRRNEIGHGIVQPIQWHDHTFGPDHQRDSTEGPWRYCLVPSHYTIRKFDLAPYRPNYAYTSVEILSLERGVRETTGEIAKFRLRVLPPQQR